MTRLFRYLDPAFGVALFAALAMVVITAWPVAGDAAEAAQAAHRGGPPAHSAAQPPMAAAADAGAGPQRSATSPRC